MDPSEPAVVALDSTSGPELQDSGSDRTPLDDFPKCSDIIGLSRKINIIKCAESFSAATIFVCDEKQS